MYKRHWLVRVVYRGFESLMLVYGTEDEMREYMSWEFDHCVPAYSGASEEEVSALKKMGAKVYLAPEVSKAHKIDN